MLEVTAELPILAFTLVRKLRPIIIGSASGWLILDGITARPRAISLRTNSGVTILGMLAPKLCPGCWLFTEAAIASGVDRKSTRLNSSHVRISYAVFCLKKKKDRTIMKYIMY